MSVHTCMTNSVCFVDGCYEGMAERRKDPGQRERFQALLGSMARLGGEDFPAVFADRLRRIVFEDVQ